MNTTKLSTKGKIVLPKAVRDAYGWQPGVELEVVARPGGVLLRTTKRVKSSNVAHLAGILARKGRKKISLKQMDAALQVKEFQ